MMYLLHIYVLVVRKGTARETIPANHYTMFGEFCLNMMGTLLVSLFAYLLVEAPASRLQKHCLSRVSRYFKGSIEKSKSQE